LQGSSNAQSWQSFDPRAKQALDIKRDCENCLLNQEIPLRRPSQLVKLQQSEIQISLPFRLPHFKDARNPTMNAEDPTSQRLSELGIKGQLYLRLSGPAQSGDRAPARTN
jgi:hypothetical protein